MAEHEKQQGVSRELDTRGAVVGKPGGRDLAEMKWGPR